jgi:hypothetical protein
VVWGLANQNKVPDTMISTACCRRPTSDIVAEACLLFLALASCGTEDAPRVPTEFTDSAGVVIAESSGFPEFEAGGWSLAQVPDLSIGNLEGDTLYQLFRVTGAVRLADGRLAITDNGSWQLRIYAPDGSFLRSFGREGEGPGEFRNIQVMGTIGFDTLVVLDGRQRRVSRVHPEIGFLGQTVLPDEAGLAMHSNGMFGDGAIVFGGLVNWARGDDTPASGYERLTNPYCSVSLDGRGIIHFGDFPGTEVVWTTSNLDGRESLAAAFVTFGLSPTAMARGKHLVLSTRDRYEVNVFDSSARLERVIRIDTPSQPVTQEHLEGRLEELLSRLPSPDLAPQVRVGFWDTPHAENMPAMESLLLDSEGYLWVEDKNLPGDTLRTWTVFDNEGVPITRLSLPMSNRVMEIGADYVLALFEDELGVEYVRFYPLNRGS